MQPILFSRQGIQLLDDGDYAQARALLVMGDRQVVLGSSDIAALQAALAELGVRQRERQRRAILAKNLSLPLSNA